MRLRPHLISRPTLLAALFATAATVTPVSASNLVVPDDSPTIQAAVDALVDTVLVRNGNYPETPVLSARVALLAIAGDPALERPILAGLRFSTPPPDIFARYLVQGFQMGGPVIIQNDEYLAEIRLEGCRLFAGIFDISAFPATVSLTLRGCEILEEAFLKADGDCVVDSCLFTGSRLVVGQENCYLTATNNVFQGNGSGYAISTNGFGGDIYNAMIANNVIQGYRAGIQMSAIAEVHIEGNTVTDLPFGGISAVADIVRIVRNTARRCGGQSSIAAIANDSLVFVSNVIENSRQVGMFVGVGSTGVIEGNVVWGSGFEGFHLVGSPEALTVRNNSSCMNGRSGFLSELSLSKHPHYEFAANIGYGNGRYGVEWGVPQVTVVRCNDWFGNGLGPVSGLPGSSEDFETDPLFCSPTGGDFRLFAGSPLVDRAGCGRVGALGVGCDVTSTTVRRFTAERVTEGIRIVWELAEPSVAALVSLERAEAGEQGPWTSVTTEIGHDGTAVTELDRSAIAERAYWYRLVASVPGSTSVVGSPIMVAAQLGPSFRLVLVGPSPASGPVRIEFELSGRATIDLAVFDVQGRVVAAPAQGVWPAGRHAVTWPSSTESRLHAGGVYLVRYRYPGGESRARVIRMP